MNLLSPINSLIFRIAVVGILIAYYLVLIKVIRQIIVKNSFSKNKKTITIMLVLFIPIGGLMLYFAFFNSPKEFEVSSK